MSNSPDRSPPREGAGDIAGAADVSAIIDNETVDTWANAMNQTANALDGDVIGVNVAADGLRSAAGAAREHVGRIVSVQEDLVGNLLQQLAALRQSIITNAQMTAANVKEANTRVQSVLESVKEADRAATEVSVRTVTAAQPAGEAAEALGAAIAGLQELTKVAAESSRTAALQAAETVPRSQFEASEARCRSLEEQRAAAVAELQALKAQAAIRSQPLPNTVGEDQQGPGTASRLSSSTVGLMSQTRTDSETGAASGVEGGEGAGSGRAGALWRVAIAAAEQTALEQQEVADQKVTKLEILLKETEEELQESRATAATVADDAQRLVFERGVLMQQISALLHRHKDSEKTPEEVARLSGVSVTDLSTFGEFALPGAGELRGASSSKPAGAQLDLKAYSIESILDLLQRNNELTRENWNLTQQIRRLETEGVPAASSGASRATGRMSARFGAANASRFSGRPSFVDASIGTKRGRNGDVDATESAIPARLTQPLGDLPSATVSPKQRPMVATVDVGTMPDSLMLLQEETDRAKKDTTTTGSSTLRGMGTELQQKLAEVASTRLLSEQLQDVARLVTLSLSANAVATGAAHATIGSEAGISVSQAPVVTALRGSLRVAAELVQRQERLIASLKAENDSQSKLLDSTKTQLAVAVSESTVDHVARTVRSVGGLVRSLGNTRAGLEQNEPGRDELVTAIRTQQERFDADWTALTALLHGALNKERMLLTLLRPDTLNRGAAGNAGDNAAAAAAFGLGGAAAQQSAVEELQSMLERATSELAALQLRRDADNKRHLEVVEGLWSAEETSRQLQKEMDELRQYVESSTVPKEQFDALEETLGATKAQVDTLTGELQDAKAAHARAVEAHEVASRQAKDALDDTTAAVANLQVSFDNERDRANRAEARITELTDSERAAKHDVNIWKDRVEVAERATAGKAAEAEQLQHTIDRLEGQFLSREESRALLLELFPTEESLTKCTDLIGSLSAHNGELQRRTAQLEVDVSALRASADEAKRLRAHEQQLRQQAELALLQAAQAEGPAARRQTAEQAATEARLSALESERRRLELQCAAHADREAAMQQQLDTLRSDPTAANVRRFGVAKTKFVQEQLEELGGKYETTQAELQVERNRVAELSGTLAAKGDEVQELLGKIEASTSEASDMMALAASTMSTLSAREATLVTTQNELEALQAAQINLQANLTTLQAEHDALTQKFEKTAKLAELEGQRWATTNAALTELQNQSAANEKEMKTLRQQLEERSTEKRRLIEDNLRLAEAGGKLEALVTELRGSAAKSVTSRHRVQPGRSLAGALQ